MGSFGPRNLVCYIFTFLLSATTFAVTQPVCKYGPPTPESYKWNFSKEAAALLSETHTDARLLRNDADKLMSYDREWNLIDWQTDGGVLSQEKHTVNNMDRILCRLRLIQRALPADQQAEIRALTPAVIEVTDNTEAAVQYLNGHHDDLFLPQYQGYAPAMYSEAGRVVAATTPPGRYMASNSTGNQTNGRRNSKSSS